MLRLALASRAWTEEGVSIRAIRGVSGHNGEQWSAICGRLGLPDRGRDRRVARANAWPRRNLMEETIMTFFTDRKGRQSRKVLVLVCSFVFLFAAFGSRALAGDDTISYTPVVEGSTPTHRSETDTFSGQVNIYVGGSFPAGTNLLYQFLFDVTTAGNTSGYIVTFRQLTGQRPRDRFQAEGGILFQLRLRSGGEGSARASILAGSARAQPPRSRFYLSHFRPRRTTSKSIGSKLVGARSFATALIVSTIPSSAMAAGANRRMTKIMTGFRFGAVSAICAGRRSRSYRPSPHPIPTTA